MMRYLFCLLWCSAQMLGSAQKVLEWDEAFARHLLLGNKRTELATYLDAQRSRFSNDSAQYWSATFYAHFNEITPFHHHFLLSRNVGMRDTLLLQRGDVLMFRADSKEQTAWFIETAKHTSPMHQNMVASYYRPLRIQIDVQSAPWQLQGSLEAYASLREKTAFGVAWRSIAIPGWGRLYSGRKRTALGVFLGTLTIGAQVFESVRRLGPANPYSILCMSYLAIFYSGEVYGNIKALNNVKEERLKQYYYDCSDYYSVLVGR